MWFNLMKTVEQVGNFIALYFQEVASSLLTTVQSINDFFVNLWTSIGNGASGAGNAIVSAFQRAFQFVLDLASSFYNSLPGWLKDALNKVGGGISGALGSAASSIAEGVGKMWIAGRRHDARR